MGRPRTVSDEALLAATARVVVREGALRFTLAQVGAEAGVSAPLLVQRFGTKRGLLLALSEASRGAPGATFARARARHASPLAALLEGLADATAPLVTPRDVARSLEYLALDLAEADFHAHARAYFVAFRAAMRDLLVEAVEAGELRDGDLDGLARALEVAFSGSTIAWGVHREGTLRDAVARDAAAVLAPWRRDPRLPRLPGLP